ncbi:Panacea domain-containing protein [Glutamicibacter arilaitensis]|uniref:Panacea domain-containing protein n=1 Tax=Glutamicibacter arilaitensis TaxID=256701 RepID=UPI003FD05FCC
MANVHDLAAYILDKTGEITSMKLQKLCYYSQAWQLVWEDRPIFNEPIQAWANGPVMPDLYREHRGNFTVSTWQKGDAKALDAGERETVDIVLESYSGLTAHQLSEMTHREDPWQSARAGLPDGSRSNATISLASMHSYYLGQAERTTNP